MLKFLILQLYYERYKMIRNSIQSVRDQTYSNWEYVFIDDGSLVPGEPIVRELMPEQLNKVKFISTGDSEAQKWARNGSLIGMHMNQAIMDSDADVVIVLCDDDYLLTDYLEKLNTYYMMHPTVMYSYCHIIPYDPINHQTTFATGNWLNKVGDIAPSCQVDSSQVTFRSICTKEGGIKFAYPMTAALDSVIFSDLHRVYGLCPFNGIIGQYKALFPDQMGQRYTPERFLKVTNV